MQLEHGMDLALRSGMKFLIPILLLPLLGGAQDRTLYRVDRSSVRFISEAPLERITASTDKTTGVLDLDQRTFAVQVPMRSLEGFNSPLQREHFNENYMRSQQFPNAVFAGRIIEHVDLRVPGEHQVRAKGMLTIHGEQRERILDCLLRIGHDGVRVTSTFGVLLEEHGVRVPRVVQQKIANEVEVEVDLHFAKPGE